jgi:nanoRNase/pAp phosphatase (c-di-AMP/oligoRNAs hydrolase)
LRLASWYGTLPSEVKKPKMENNKKQLIERIKSVNNVLVTVSANPSVDQLSAAIGLTVMLNKLDKHATAVFSGKTPSTIEFLHPENTLEKNTDSLRDFIIALDKAKADKLRYKVEEDHVKIFITPYRTSISQADLEFSQGDFNVELVIALGVNEQQDLDQAIISHGRILHDATTVAVTTGAVSKLGSINWADEHASSLCEMVASLSDDLGADLLDSQVATALMTGIVAETDRFSNEKTLPNTMTLSAKLMAAGANQQLVASKLEEPAPTAAAQPTSAPSQNEQSGDGSLTIAHTGNEYGDEEPQGEPVDKIHIDEHGTVQSLKDAEVPVPEPSPSELVLPQELPEEGLPELPKQEPLPEIKNVKGGGGYLAEPEKPKDTELSVGNVPTGYEDPSDTLNAPMADIPLLNRDGDTTEESSDTHEPKAEQPPEAPEPSPVFEFEQPVEPVAPPEPLPEPPAPEPQPVQEESPQTLSELEAAVQASYESNNAATPAPPAPEVPAMPTPEQVTPAIAGLDSARDAVSEALASIGTTTPPADVPPLTMDVAQPVDPIIESHFDPSSSAEPPVFTMPENLVPPKDLPVDTTATSVSDPTAPPAVPPPFMPDMNSFTDPTLPPQDAGPTPGPSNPQNPFNLPPA